MEKTADQRQKDRRTGIFGIIVLIWAVLSPLTVYFAMLACISIDSSWVGGGGPRFLEHPVLFVVLLPGALSIAAGATAMVVGLSRRRTAVVLEGTAAVVIGGPVFFFSVLAIGLAGIG